MKFNHSNEKRAADYFNRRPVCLTNEEMVYSTSCEVTARPPSPVPDPVGAEPSTFMPMKRPVTAPLLLFGIDSMKNTANPNTVTELEPFLPGVVISGTTTTRAS